MLASRVWRSIRRCLRSAALGFKRGPLRLERCLTLAVEPGEARQPLRTAFHRSPPRDPERERLDEDLQGGLHGEIKQADAAEEHDRRRDEIDRNLRSQLVQEPEGEVQDERKNDERARDAGTAADTRWRMDAATPLSLGESVRRMTEAEGGCRARRNDPSSGMTIWTRAACAGRPR